MPDRIDKIHEVLLQQNKDSNTFQLKVMEDLNTVKNKVASIEIQTIKTNGRVTALEGQMLLIEKNNEKQVVVTAVNKKWLGVIIAILLGLWGIISVSIANFLPEIFKKWVK